MAVVREAGIGCEHREVMLTVGQSLDREGQAEPEDISGDRFPRCSPELSGQVERRAAQRLSEALQIPAHRRGAREHRPGVLDPQPLARAEPTHLLRGRERSRQRGQQQKDRVLGLEVIDPRVAEHAGEHADRKVIARSHPPEPSFDPAHCLLEHIRPDDDDRALIAVAGRVTHPVFVIGGKKDRCPGVDDDGRATALQHEDATPREPDLGDGVVHREPVARSRRSTQNIEDPDERGLDQQVSGLLLGHDHILRDGRTIVTAAHAVSRYIRPMRRTTGPHAASAMIEALHAEGPHPEHADKLMLFGRLVGSWDIVGRFFDEDGNVTRESTGEWHFGWVLEGRVIQDVIIAPRREGRGPGVQSKAYDTAIRSYDPKTDSWRVTVVAPVYGATVHLIAREHDEEIWLDGRDQDDNLIRWTFSEFSEERVRWQGFVSKDEGQPWVRDEEILLHRRRTD
jgi:hypothetical protein